MPRDVGQVPEPSGDRAADEAARRARGKVRRYCAANRLNRLGTLTYGPPFCRDADALREDVGTFFRHLRRRTGPLPYLWTPELHSDGERYHVHFAVGRFVHYAWIREAWGRGHVHIKLLGDLPVGSGSLGEARLAARYLSKYIGKALDASPYALHRYEVAEGYQPQSVRIEASSLGEVWAEAAYAMAGEPEYRWDSGTDPGWRGPHAVWASWAD